MAIDEKKLIEELCNQYQKYNLDTWNEAIDRAIQIVESQPKISLENKTSDNMHSACSGQVWIPVSENLPIGGELVIVTFEDLEVECAWFDAVYCRWNVRGYFIDDCEVIAWMPLPKPYKSER